VAHVAEVLVAHPADVVLEVAEFPVQVFGLDSFQGVLAGGGDDRLDVPGVQVVEPADEPLRRVGVMKAR
jgi:hypothetical protein